MPDATTRPASGGRWQLPEAVAGARLLLEPRSVLAIGVLCAAALGATAWFVLRGSPAVLPPP
ncbi:MAG: hypothetical protein ACXV2J_15525, partial [Actinomycetes bacterium]